MKILNRKMKILAVSCRIPAQGRKGEQIVSYNHLTALAQDGHTVQLLCFGDHNNTNDLNARLELERVGINVQFIRWSLFEALVNAVLLGLVYGLPLQCAIFKSRAFIKKFKSLLKIGDFDAVYCVLSRVALNIEGYSGPLYVDLVDSMRLNFQRRVKAVHGLFRILLTVESNRIGEFEFALAERSTQSIVVSRIDYETIGSSRVSVIPIGVDLDRFQRRRELSEVPKIVFTGNMNYTPNIEAVLWFIDNCWEAIKARIPDSVFVIAGSNPHRRIRKLAVTNRDVIVTGRVPSIADIYKTANVSVAPMQSGSGMQFKLLEAMACSVPVVTTTIGLGGLGAQVGRDLLVADSASAFVEAVVTLFSSTFENTTMGGNGFKYVSLNHDWRSLNQHFIDVITSN